MTGSFILAKYRLAAKLGFAVMIGAIAQMTVVPESESKLVAQENHWCVFEPDQAGEATKHIVLISGDEEYRSEEAMPMLGKLLAKHHGFHCTVLFAINPDTGEIDPNNQNNIPGMAMLDAADLVIIALRFRQLPDDDMRHFVSYLNRGEPIIGLRTSTHAFRYPGDSNSEFKKFGFNSRQWPGGFGKQVLGETWVSHHGHHKVESTRGIINKAFSEHPILNGVSDVWGPTDVYGIRELPKNAQVLLHGQVLTGMKPNDPPVEGKKNDPMMPLAWIREYETESGKTSRIFCTTMGSSNDFESAGLRRLVVNAAHWCLEDEKNIDPDSSVDIVGNYEPTMYGFNSFKTGMQPSDFK